MFPLIPILALAAILGGAGTLAWYNRLSREEKDAANRLTAGYARDVFEKQLSELTRAEAEHVHALTKRHFVN